MSGGRVVLVAYDAVGNPHDILVDASGYLIPAQAMPPTTIGHGSQTTNAGTRIALVPGGLAVREVMVTAKINNIGAVYVGGATVSSASYGKRLLYEGWVNISIDDLSKVFIDVEVNGEGADFLYVV